MGKAKAALLAGLATGVISGIPLVNIGCCLYAIGGGILAAFLLYRETRQMSLGEGTLVGLFAGLIAGAIGGVINVTISAMTNSVTQSMQQFQGEVSMATAGALAYVMTFVAYVLILSVFCLIGGLIGGAIFQNRGNPASKAKPVN